MDSNVVQLNLVPIQQATPLAVEDPGVIGSWRMLGDDPAFQCSWGGGALAGGWYEVLLQGSVDAGRMTNAFLYPDYGRGFEEAHKVSLGLDARSGTEFGERVVVRFTEVVRGMRFDPSVAPCELTLRGFRLRRLGKFEAGLKMLVGGLASSRGLKSKLRLLARAAVGATRGLSAMADALYHAYAARRIVPENASYAIWLDFYDKLDAEALQSAKLEAAGLAHSPLVSVLVPTYNTPEPWLRKCLDSVLNQVYPNWELCVADDASTSSATKAILEEYRRRDGRIKVVFRGENGHISAASNSALEMATGEYVALLDHDDELHPFALLECVKAFNSNPRWEMLFTDEDKVDESGERSDPYFKSDWNPDLFFSQNCVCHLTVYRRRLLQEVGGFALGTEGAQDWDLTLRVVERLEPDQIGHVAKVLYHWRMISGSTALAPGEKSYAHLAALKTLGSYFERNRIAAKVLELPGYSGYFRVSYEVPSPQPLVSLLIPTKDRVDLLEQCIGSILEKTDYRNFEILILDNGSREPRTHRYFKRITSDARARVVEWPHAFNYSAINNFGARFAEGRVLGLLNNDVEVINPEWLDEMVGHALRPEIGVVGAMLYYPDDTVQHAGVVLGIGGVAGHAYVGMSRGYPGHKHRGRLAQSISAVTAAAAVVRTEVFREVGGLDEQLQVAFNDIDLCLRVREKGYRNLWTPFAELYHHESATRGYETTPEKARRFRGEERFMRERWGRLLDEDPYYNPNFTLTGAPYTLAYPPRHHGTSVNGEVGARP